MTAEKSRSVMPTRHARSTPCNGSGRAADRLRRCGPPDRIAAAHRPPSSPPSPANGTVTASGTAVSRVPSAAQARPGPEGERRRPLAVGEDGEGVEVGGPAEGADRRDGDERAARHRDRRGGGGGVGHRARERHGDLEARAGPAMAGGRAVGEMGLEWGGLGDQRERGADQPLIAAESVRPLTLFNPPTTPSPQPTMPRRGSK